MMNDESNEYYWKTVNAGDRPNPAELYGMYSRLRNEIACSLANEVLSAEDLEGFVGRLFRLRDSAAYYPNSTTARDVTFYSAIHATLLQHIIDRKGEQFS